MRKSQDYYPDCPEAMIVGLARNGDRNAFEELVRRRQSWVRNLMRRCCGEATLADDLAQQAFLQVWLKIHTLREADAFVGWLKRLAVTVWLQHLRKKDALMGAQELADNQFSPQVSSGVGIDLDRALATLTNGVRLCVVLSYQEGFSHREISELTAIPLGTVKSHINRGSQQLRQVLEAYKDQPDAENLP